MAITEDVLIVTTGDGVMLLVSRRSKPQADAAEHPAMPRTAPKTKNHPGHENPAPGFTPLTSKSLTIMI